MVESREVMARQAPCYNNVQRYKYVVHWVLLVLGIIYLCQKFDVFYQLVVVGTFLSYFFYLPAEWARAKYRVPRWATVLGINVLLLVLIGAGIYQLVPFAWAEAQEIFMSIRSGELPLNVQAVLEKLEIDANSNAQVQEVLKFDVASLNVSGLFSRGVLAFSALFHGLENFIIVFLFVFLTACWGDDVMRGVKVMIQETTTPYWNQTLCQGLEDLDGRLRRIIKGQAYVAMVMMCVATVAYFVLFAAFGKFTSIGLVLAIGITVGCTSIFPVVGSVVSGVMGVFVATYALIDAGVYIVAPIAFLMSFFLGLYESKYLTLKIMGKQAMVHTLIVFFSLLFFTKVFGLFGTMLANHMMVVTLVAIGIYIRFLRALGEPPETQESANG